jgi:hypothetical protein
MAHGRFFRIACHGHAFAFPATLLHRVSPSCSSSLRPSSSFGRDSLTLTGVGSDGKEYALIGVVAADSTNYTIAISTPTSQVDFLFWFSLSFFSLFF